MKKSKINLLVLVGASIAIVIWAYLYRCAIPTWWIVLILIIFAVYTYSVWKNYVKEKSSPSISQSKE